MNLNVVLCNWFLLSCYCAVTVVLMQFYFCVTVLLLVSLWHCYVLLLCYCGVTAVLLWCYSCVTVVLLWCYCVTELMKEPILQDKRQQHVKFCKCASELIESVLGKPQNASIEASLERIRKVSCANMLFLVMLVSSRFFCNEKNCFDLKLNIYMAFNANWIHTER